MPLLGHFSLSAEEHVWTATDGSRGFSSVKAPTEVTPDGAGLSESRRLAVARFQGLLHPPTRPRGPAHTAPSQPVPSVRRGRAVAHGTHAHPAQCLGCWVCPPQGECELPSSSNTISRFLLDPQIQLGSGPTAQQPTDLGLPFPAGRRAQPPHQGTPALRRGVSECESVCVCVCTGPFSTLTHEVPESRKGPMQRDLEALCGPGTEVERGSDSDCNFPLREIALVLPSGVLRSTFHTIMRNRDV